MMKRLTLFFLLHCCCQLAFAGGGVGNVIKKLGTIIDHATRKGIDSTYIIVPQKPWQLISRTNVNQTTYYMDAVLVNDPEIIEYKIDFEPTLTTGVGMSTGLWLGYRGYGLGYLKSISKNDDYNFSLSACGSKYGLNFRLRHYDATKMDLHFVASFPGLEDPEFQNIEMDENVDLEAPISYKTMFVEGYYLFNGKRYSNTAVFDQSVQQVKSAGSLMAGFTWFKSTVEYANQESATIIDFMNNVGQTKQWQFAVGAGYAYNWVPQRNWLLSIQAMPMLTLLNHIKTWEYKLDYHDMEESEDGEYPSPTLIPDKVETKKSHIMPGGVARAGVVYNHKQFFVTAGGQISTYGYKHDNNSLRLVDWYANASLGVRF